ncbi:MAG TPA: hypothetical protein VNS19_19075 [Acidimicrobiales bacterium]|nr:hypothetical protein [Acidimicrobiales bacterium]
MGARPTASRRILLLLVGAALLVAGCSSSSADDGAGDADRASTTTTADRFAPVDEVDDTEPQRADGTEAEYVAAFESDLLAGGGQGDPPFTEEEAACVAPRWVDAITVEALRASGTAPDEVGDFDITLIDPDPDRGQVMVDALTDCGIDVVAVVAQSFAAQSDTELQACAEREIDPELAEALLVTGFGGAGEDEISTAYAKVMSQLSDACGQPGG